MRVKKRTRSTTEEEEQLFWFFILAGHRKHPVIFKTLYVDEILTVKRVRNAVENDIEACFILVPHASYRLKDGI